MVSSLRKSLLTSHPSSLLTEHSERMYKQRIQEWGLLKNHRRQDRDRVVTYLRGPCAKRSNQILPQINGEAVNLRKISRYVPGLEARERRRRRSSSHASTTGNAVVEEIDSVSYGNTADVETFEPMETTLALVSSSVVPVGPNDTPHFDDTFNTSTDMVDYVEPTPVPIFFSRVLTAPNKFKYLEDILNHIDQYYRSCFYRQGTFFSNQVLNSVGVRVVEIDDEDKGLHQIHDPGYAAIYLAKSGQYREARILIGEASDHFTNLLKAQHPTLLPFLLELICEDSTTPHFNVSEGFRQHVHDLCAVIKGAHHPLTMILHLLGLVGQKLETCAMILSKIQSLLSAEFGKSQWEARRPVKVYSRVLRHLGRFDEVERILPTSLDAYDETEKPSQSEWLGLLYERAWLSARGRHDNAEAREHFKEILQMTADDAEVGQISHFRIKANRGLGVLASEEERYEVSAKYFADALDESRKGFGRRDSNTVRIGSELEESLRKLGRVEEAEVLRRERDQLFWREDVESLRKLGRFEEAERLVRERGRVFWNHNQGMASPVCVQG
jgi:tetratricopeptide (TPR) repeat protein